MTTIKDKLRFNFNGVWSNTHGLLSVNVGNGMFEETLVAQRELNETKIRGNPKPMLHGIEDSPLQLELTLAFETDFTDAKVDAIIRWLFVDHYRPLYFEGKESKIYMCLPIDSSQIIHNGINQGYITIMMRCDSANVYSPTIITPLETVSTNKTITIVNDGHFEIYPEISFKKNGVGTIIIESLDDGNNIFEVRDLTNLEDIYLDCKKEIIITDAIGVYRYDKLIGYFPRLVSGTNRFKITGACTIQFKYKKIYRF